MKISGERSLERSGGNCIGQPDGAAVVTHTTANLTQLFVERRSYLEGYARRITRSVSDSEDVVQDAYCKASQSLQKFQGRSSLLSWVCVIVRNEALSQLRRRRGHEQVSLDTELEHPEAVLAGASARPSGPEEMYLQAEALRRIQKQLALYPREVQAIFDLYYLKECTLEEVAVERKKTVSAVKGHLHRGKAALRHEGLLSYRAAYLRGGAS